MGKASSRPASWGYDGKGQQTVSLEDDLNEIWQGYAGQETILEGFVDFEDELSVIGVRDAAGNFTCYEPIKNGHANHILDISTAGPRQFSQKVIDGAQEIAHTVMDSLDAVGVLCVELFRTEKDDLLVNEIAPRPHNSGHLTIDAHYCCQFAQQVRAICGLPLGSTELRQPAAMANLLGDLWPDGGTPPWQKVLGQPHLRLHLYGKESAKARRKMGHMTALAETIDEAESLVRKNREALLTHA